MIGNSLNIAIMRSEWASKSDARHARRTLGICGGAHCLHDGFTDAIYVLLPIWYEALGLSLVQVGLLKSITSAALAGLQMPAGFLAERFGAKSILTAGTIVAGLGYILAGFAGGFIGLALALAVVGSGAAVQHPLSSALVADAYHGGGRRAALGIYNFTGDLGKMILPTSVALGIGFVGWRMSSFVVGLLGVAGGLVIWMALRRMEAVAIEAGKAAGPSGPVKGWGIRDPLGFSYLSTVGLLDTATRYAFLSFLPFLLMEKGAEIESVGFAMTLVFAGGAVGKFACGLLAERFGIIRTVVLTEICTALGIVVLLFAPLLLSLLILPLIGVALNGTSSVLYGTVSEFVEENRQARAFSLFYTIGLGSGAVAPIIFGAIGDAVSVTFSLGLVAAMALLIIAICPILAPKITENAA
jgi:MFS family permease